MRKIRDATKEEVEFIEDTISGKNYDKHFQQGKLVPEKAFNCGLCKKYYIPYEGEAWGIAPENSKAGWSLCGDCFARFHEQKMLGRTRNLPQDTYYESQLAWMEEERKKFSNESKS